MNNLSCVTVTLITAISTCIKVLLVPCYMSTDFEVHRNWLAITNTLPHKLWYYESTSEWTLDYPPLFAWFEFILSHIASSVDPSMLVISNLNYKSDLTLYFQRTTVIMTDFLLIYSSYRCSLTLPKSVSKVPKQNAPSYQARPIILMILIACNCGLFIVDHIHFQYNGFLFGILFLSFANLIEGNILMGSFWFSVLLNFKHIFLYIAPAYGIFLLRTYCIDRLKFSWAALRSFSFAKFFSLAFVVLSVFFISFGPFISHIPQVLSRLFPFKRGLTHAYWAPNFWALYNFADKALATGGKQFGFITGNITSSSASGLVQTVEHAVLPSISPTATFLLTFLAMIPCLANIWFRPCANYNDSINQFLRAIVLCSLSSFMFGWHVHEKAILMAILPFTLLALRGAAEDAKLFLFLQTVGHYSLFPLIFTQFETVVKICLALLYSIFAFAAFKHIYAKKSTWHLPFHGTIESLYLYGLVVIEIYCSVIHPFTFLAQRFAFLPLLLTSTYCALGVTWTWLLLYKNTLMSNITPLHKETKYKR